MNKFFLIAGLLCTTMYTATAAELHVAINGDDSHTGAADKPFRHIQAAADLAQPGDTITVHAGVYRERINPPRGGTSDTRRITYQAAPGEKVTLTGSDLIKKWVKVSDDAWKLTLPNSYFGSFNPYAEKVYGDWFNPNGRTHHRGNVYLKGAWIPEAPNLNVVLKAGNTPAWFATVDGVHDDAPAHKAEAAKDSDEEKTIIYARFPDANPNDGSVEICVRPTVFTPEKTNINYITLRGFDLRNAGPNWAAPTSGQQGLVTAYWCKGWIIENNEISYSRCCGIALGKYSDQWDNRRGNKTGYDGTIHDALETGGWTKEKIGGHIVRNNHIHHCGQTGIVGSLGCAFSQIIGNEIHDINMQGIWAGAEMAGIKFHGAIDVVIRDNHIYRCGPVAGLWLDWMAQGTQIIGNLLHDNTGRQGDLFCEVDHGPFLVANNIMLSSRTHTANSQGGAYVHNLMQGGIQAVTDSRRTPYHMPHSTKMVGAEACPIGDVRWYNNQLAGHASLDTYNSATLPVTACGNVYNQSAEPSKFDTDALVKPGFNPGIKLVQKADGWHLSLAQDPTWSETVKRPLVTTKLLGKAKIPDQAFENPDASPLSIDTDYFGKPRNSRNPFPGPFEPPVNGEIKVWPKK